MGIIRKYKHFILLIIFPVLLLFITNSLINRHNHHIRGYEFSHAHPFTQEGESRDYPLHKHTDAELVMLNLLGDISFLVCIALFIIWIPLGSKKTLPAVARDLPTVQLLSLYSPRAPPVYTL